MQTLKCNIGMWKVRAKVESLEDSKLMVLVSAMAGNGKDAIESKHIVVCDHIDGADRIEEAKNEMKRILRKAH
jgi:hypothetical protein